ncbi:hypothetical protein PC41400_08120 [Paenibacillus chitinolyticus]|uniref:Uncharacterized protein n=1 Tax=Paenibacillus chitinolyticus TaxID=79263 RepID=A0A410WTF9_9BACL|nr:hypothetical protein [Paenibacillus chitinolyticus]MCY9599126.1 hypothetical protein [Paenibacillus chitinolyticus]QAV17632.1 hypothetical protein PC41400_08120 [Paenibacillus chitinolyticus]
MSKAYILLNENGDLTSTFFEKEFAPKEAIEVNAPMLDQDKMNTHYSFLTYDKETKVLSYRYEEIYKGPTLEQQVEELKAQNAQMLLALTENGLL